MFEIIINILSNKDLLKQYLSVTQMNVLARSK